MGEIRKAVDGERSLNGVVESLRNKEELKLVKILFSFFKESCQDCVRYGSMKDDLDELDRIFLVPPSQATSSILNLISVFYSYGLVNYKLQNLSF